MSEKKQHALQVIQTLHQAGFLAFLVGGCVRDLLLNREPADYDVSTDATPDDGLLDADLDWIERSLARHEHGLDSPV